MTGVQTCALPIFSSGYENNGLLLFLKIGETREHKERKKKGKGKLLWGLHLVKQKEKDYNSMTMEMNQTKLLSQK